MHAGRIRGGQQMGTGGQRARGSRRALPLRFSEPRGAVGGTCETRGAFPAHAVSDLSSAEMRRQSLAVGRYRKGEVAVHPSRESAVHGPSFPAAAIHQCGCVGVLRCTAVRLCRAAPGAKNVSDESRKMIRASSRYLHAHIACQQNPCVHARKMRGDASRCFRCVVRVALRACATRCSSSRGAFPPPAIAAGTRRVSRGSRAARRGAARRRCTRRAGGSAGCRRPAPARAPPSR